MEKFGKSLEDRIKSYKDKIEYENTMLAKKSESYEKVLLQQFEDYKRKMQYAEEQNAANVAKYNRKITELEELLHAEIL